MIAVDAMVLNQWVRLQIVYLASKNKDISKCYAFYHLPSAYLVKPDLLYCTQHHTLKIRAE